MAISKLILNGVTQMDVTQDTVEANNLLLGETATKNDGTKVTGTYVPSPVAKHTATITVGCDSQTNVTYNNTTYRSTNSTFEFSAGDTCELPAWNDMTNNGSVYVDDVFVSSTGRFSPYTYTLPDCDINFELSNGGTAYVKVYTLGSSDNGYTRTLVVPQQTFTPDSSRRATLTGMVSGLVDGGDYIVTFDNAEWLVTCDILWSVDYVLGEPNFFFSTGDYVTPFAIAWETGTSCTVATANTSQHTIKVERLELLDSGTTLMPKSITANGTYNASSDSADGYSSVTVNVSGGGGGEPVPAKDVNFIDYDGTILHSYTKAEALALDALPSNPSHAGLTAQGWNYTLAEIKTECNSVGKCTVGQMYVTQSGDTEIDVLFPDAARLSPILTIAVNGTVTVDWGDNTTANTVTASSLTTRQAVPHTYANKGEYTIKIHAVSGSFTFYGSTSYYLLRKNTTGNENRVYSNCVQAIRLGSGITSIGDYAFYYCMSLASITIPNSVTSIGASAFHYCLSLESVTIPSGITSIGSSALYSCYSLSSVAIPNSVTSIVSSFSICYSLASIAIPNSVTSIGATTFSSCMSLASIIVPSGVTSIGNGAFQSCYGIAEYHLKPTTPPTLGSSVFSNIVSDCIIYVPRSENQTVLNNYKTETNWSAYASYMQEEPA